MTALLTGLASLLVFGGVVLVHELGHFMAARHCGIHVEEFSIGFGPRLWAVQKNGTTYSLRLFPLGGYNLFSQPPEEDADPPAEESAPPRKAALFPLTVSGQQFEQATAWQRFFVTLCGALMNFLLGMAVLLVLVLSQGRLGSTTVADFGENAKSAAVLQKGDVLLQVDGKPCRTVYALSDLFDGTEKTHTMKVLRGGKVVTLPAVTVSPTLDENGRVQYATDFRVAAQPLSVHSTLAMAGELFRYYSGAILGGFWQLFTGKAGMEDLSGPIGTVSAVSQAVRYGWRDVLSLMALLTINVGIFNLLPIPALDGCKLLFLAWEGLTGHPVPLRAQSFINTAGMVALLWLMILVTMQDITRFL
ncbi:M50 family metallopeptidase [Gemmiger sp.]|uniref:M50 family metallopeptidase n=1 Tax=Gemmiger sp. TaxID=2049027 RepID=UPI002E7A2BC1|nr:M50 family metallopeptidase [Gemmiger sp.]MEE1424314.1 M50 family metallopeptidase [Gemmiger sp.]